MTLLPPSEAVQKRIREHLYQDPSVTRNDVKHLHEWISKQPHLPQEHDDQWLEALLCGCKYSLEKTKRHLENRYAAKLVIPYFFCNTDPSSKEMRDISKIWYSFLLPEYTPDGYRVFMWRLTEGSHSNIIETLLRKVMHIVTSYYYMETNPAFVLVNDLRGVPISFVTGVIPYLKDIFYLYNECSVLHVKQMHIITSSSQVLSYLLSAVTPFLKEKLRKRIHIHTDDFSSLYYHIPKEMLPIDYGGQGLSSKEYNDSWQNRLESMKSKIEVELSKKIDESKQMKGNVESGNFGLDGSFKSLNID